MTLLKDKSSKKIPLAIKLAALAVVLLGCSEKSSAPSANLLQLDAEPQSIQASQNKDFPVSEGGGLIAPLTAGSSLEVAHSVNGHFVVVWRSTNGSDIYARLFNAEGSAQGASFVLGAGNMAVDPVVAMDAVGNFTVAWRTLTGNGNGNDIRFQRFDSKGNALGSAQSVPLYTGLLDLALPQQDAIQGVFLKEGPQQLALAMEADGNFVVGWVRHGWGRLCCIPDLALQGSPLQARLYTVFYTRTYSAAGEAKSAPTMVAVQSEDWPPALAMNSSGGFIAAWREGGLLAGNELSLRLFDSDSNATTDAIVIPDTSRSTPSLGIDANDNYVLLWSQGNGPDFTIKAQRFEQAGSPVGDLLSVAGDDLSDPPFIEPARLAVAPSGSFAAVWAQRSRVDIEVPEYDVYMRCYTAKGTPAGEPVIVNGTPLTDTFTLADVAPAQPTVASDGFGDYIVVWQRSLDGVSEIQGRLMPGC